MGMGLEPGALCESSHFQPLEIKPRSEWLSNKCILREGTERTHYISLRFESLKQHRR